MTIVYFCNLKLTMNNDSVNGHTVYVDICYNIINNLCTKNYLFIILSITPEIRH